MPKVQIISDVHSRWDRVAIDPEAKLIIAAGDMTEGVEGVHWLAQHGIPTLYIPGNHEFYDADIQDRLDQLRAAAKGTCVSIMWRSTALAGDWRFICATLWTDHNGLDMGLMEKSMKIMNDYRHIRIDRWLSYPENQSRYLALRSEFEDANPNLGGILPAKAEFMNPIAALCLHSQDVEHLTRELAKPWKGRTAVISHHAPSSQSLAMAGYFPSNDVGGFASILPWIHKPHKIGAYASSLEYLFSNHKIDFWVHGHMHEGLRYSIHGTDVITNPTGYTDDQNSLYRPSFCINLLDPARHCKVLAFTAARLMEIQQGFMLPLINCVSGDGSALAMKMFPDTESVHIFAKLYNMGISSILQQAPKDVPQASFRAEVLGASKLLHDIPPGRLTPARRLRAIHEMLSVMQSNQRRSGEWQAYLFRQPALQGWTLADDINGR